MLSDSRNWPIQPKGTSRTTCQGNPRLTIQKRPALPNHTSLPGPSQEFPAGSKGQCKSKTNKLYFWEEPAKKEEAGNRKQSLRRRVLFSYACAQTKSRALPKTKPFRGWKWALGRAVVGGRWSGSQQCPGDFAVFVRLSRVPSNNTEPNKRGQRPATPYGDPLKPVNFRLRTFGKFPPR